MFAEQKFINKPWGDEGIVFQLPGYKLYLCGLSKKQKQQLLIDYAEFVIDPNEEGIDYDVNRICHAYQLKTALNIPIKSLKQGNQYVPQKKRIGNIIDITGINFKASFNSDTRQAYLGVASEDELSQPTVIENFLRIYSAYNAVYQTGILLHSAGVVVNKQAYLFVGSSGAGKTTLTRKAFQDSAGVLSDDINLILPKGSGFVACKVPFTGEFGRTVIQDEVASYFPVKAIALLEQKEELCVEHVSAPYAISRLIANSPFVNDDVNMVGLLFDIYSELISRLPVIKLGVNYHDKFDAIYSQIGKEVNSK